VKRAIILHGTLGSPEGNWFRWLEQKLKEAGLGVWLPQLPDADQPSLRVWLDYLGAVVGVSVFCDNSLNWGPNAQLFDVDFNWGALRTMSDRLLYIHSNNDPYVPLQKAAYVATQTGAELLVWPEQGHFNLEKSDAYKEFPALLKEIKERKYI
jgi:predicted alpha/beta hydrolase family esterase